VSPLPAEQQARLLAAKLSGLVSSHTGRGSLSPVGFPGGAAVMLDDTAWVLADDRPGRGLGAALAWAGRNGASSLAIIADSGAGVLARRATAFTVPTTVWMPVGRELVGVEADAHRDVPAASPDEIDAARSFVHLGVDVVVEHAVVTLEVRGLEVAKVTTVDGQVVVQPGVGRNDRDGHATLLGSSSLDSGDPAIAATVARVAAEVQRHRGGEAADRHPLGRMARQRWLRRYLMDHPHLVGAVDLAPLDPAVERVSVNDIDATFARGVGIDGTGVVVACTAGIDIDLVPAAADVWLGQRAVTPGGEVRLVVAAADRDLQPVTRRLCDLLETPAAIVALDDNWYHQTPA